MKEQVTIDDFKKLDLRVGEIISASEVAGSDKLVELKVDFGEFQRTIYAGVKAWYTPESLVGRKLAFIVNLAPRTFKIFDKEYISEGMLVAAGADRAYLYSFDEDIPLGAVLR